jgi:AraC family transcriptional regulator
MDQVYVSRTLYAPPSDRIIDPGIPDHSLSLHIANPGNLERQLERRIDGGKRMDRPTYPGTFTFVPAFRESEWMWDSEVEILELYLSATFLERIAIENCDRTPQTIELIDRFAMRDLLLEQLALTLYTELTHNPLKNQLYIESLQHLVAVHLLRHHCATEVLETPAIGKLSPLKLHQVIDYIQVHLERNMELKEFAELTQLSVHHFGKLFKQSMGVPLHQYVLKCRIKRAKELLVDPQLSIVEIAQRVGFCDQSHFTNVFRRHTNLTPRQYRNRC